MASEDWGTTPAGNPYRTYSDGSPKKPHLGTFCEDGEYHRICGGWWCTCPRHDDWDIGVGGHITEHVEHEWIQEGACVYCEPCGVRLYQGEIAVETEKRVIAAAFDAMHNKIASEWSHMREQVLAARSRTDV